MAIPWPPLLNLWTLLLATWFLLLLMMTPFTKVEESFFIQGMFDTHQAWQSLDWSTLPDRIIPFLNETTPIPLKLKIIWDEWNAYRQVHWDHATFPGVVPRSFLPSIVLGTLAHFSQLLLTLFSMNPSLLAIQFIVRAWLGIFVARALVQYALVTAMHFQKPAMAPAMIVLWMTQFHLCFYATRPLANIFALILGTSLKGIVLILVVLKASTAMTQRQYKSMIFYYAFDVIVLRSDVILLAVPHVLIQMWRTRKQPQGLSFWIAFNWGLIDALLALTFTILLDSFMWGEWVWPEGRGLWFNVWMNRSLEYGISPWHWYWTSALPRALGPVTVFCLLIGIVRGGKEVQWHLVTPLLFVFSYSFLAHKELRFLFYAIPSLTAVASQGLLFLLSSKKWWLRCFVSLIMMGSLAIPLFITFISSFNYAGGQALGLLHDLVPCQETKPYQVYLDNFVAQTGASRFGQSCPYWRYDKLESNANTADIWVRSLDETTAMDTHWQLLAHISAFEGLNISSLSSQLQNSLKKCQFQWHCWQQEPILDVFVVKRAKVGIWKSRREEIEKAEKEKLERLKAEKEQKEAIERKEREEQEGREKEAQERREKEARERREREALERQERETRERRERERREREEHERREKEKRLRYEREQAERELREQAERDRREQAERDRRERERRAAEQEKAENERQRKIEEQAELERQKRLAEQERQQKLAEEAELEKQRKIEERAEWERQKRLAEQEKRRKMEEQERQRQLEEEKQRQLEVQERQRKLLEQAELERKRKLEEQAEQERQRKIAEREQQQQEERLREERDKKYNERQEKQVEIENSQQNENEKSSSFKEDEPVVLHPSDGQVEQAPMESPRLVHRSSDDLPQRQNIHEDKTFDHSQEPFSNDQEASESGEFYYTDTEFSESNDGFIPASSE